ncbi:hypothetical protein B0H14DRAFT_1334384 [Mycena olivaceomarginata]|nr:hypothetical protein B0H14DRAFT_1334384 [Mycena olivaceomarginata]
MYPYCITRTHPPSTPRSRCGSRDRRMGGRGKIIAHRTQFCQASSLPQGWAEPFLYFQIGKVASSECFRCSSSWTRGTGCGQELRGSKKTGVRTSGHPLGKLARTRGAISCEDPCVVGRSMVCPGGVSCALPSAVRGMWGLDRRIMDTRVRCACRGWAWGRWGWGIVLDVSETAPPPAVYDERGSRLTLRLEICTYSLRGWRRLLKIASLRCF